LDRARASAECAFYDEVELIWADAVYDFSLKATYQVDNANLGLAARRSTLSSQSTSHREGTSLRRQGWGTAMRGQSAISPQVYARIGGGLYLFIIIAGIYGEIFVRSHLIAEGNATLTAQKIMASEVLFRSGIVGDLMMHLCDIPLTLIVYVLLKPVSKNLSLLAALFSLVQTAILSVNKLTLVAVVLLLEPGNYMREFEPRQISALMSLCLALHGYGFGIGLIFFGVSCLVAGYLLYQSGYFPKILGILQAIAGLCYLVNSLLLLLAPAVAKMMFPAILLPAFIGELSTALWLLVKGVNTSKWAERVRVEPRITSPN
jgi:hypothetical protein